MSDTTNLAHVTSLVNQLKDFNRQINALEEQLKELSAQRDRLSNQEIPDIFMAAGLEELKLDTGEKVQVTAFYSASLSDENPNKPAALTWLRQHNFDAIIKNQVVVPFGKGEDAKAKQVVAQLRLAGYEPRQLETVHPQTLKAFVRERIESGEEFPRELFKVYEGKQTKIK